MISAGTNFSSAQSSLGNLNEDSIRNSIQHYSANTRQALRLLRRIGSRRLRRLGTPQKHLAARMIRATSTLFDVMAYGASGSSNVTKANCVRG